MLTDMAMLDAETRKHYFKTLVKDKRFRELRQFKTRMIKLVYFLQHGRCFFCKVKLRTDVHQCHPERLTKEHLVPKSRGSRWIDNPALSCYLCNKYKKNMTAEEFVLSAEFETVFKRRLKQGVYRFKKEDQENGNKQFQSN